jgi:hypothetical protein
LVAKSRGKAGRALFRVLTGENLDLYVLAVAALAFTILGAFDVTDIKTLTSVLLGLLALLAVSQIRSRGYVTELAKAQRQTGSLFQHNFPPELLSRRTSATDVLAVGLSMTRTVHGMRTDMYAMLKAGGRIRVVVLDPTNDALVEAAERMVSASFERGKLRRRIMSTLEDLESLREMTDGRLEVRVASHIPTAGITGLDLNSPGGVISVQHYEYRSDGESAPIFRLTPQDAAWYRHFVAEAERIWRDATPWPLSLPEKLSRARRPVFSELFDPDINEVMDAGNELLIIGMARNHFVHSRYSRIEAYLKTGRRIRFVLLDPKSAAVDSAEERYYAERARTAARSKIEHTLQLLAELKESTGGDLSVRLSHYPVAMGTVVIHGDNPAIFAQYYSYRVSNQPRFVLQPGDGMWFHCFLDEAEALWNSATPLLLDP